MEERARPGAPRDHEALSRASSRTTASTSTCGAGEVHALLGENGAGKSTLMNVLYGLYKPDEGEILLTASRSSLKSAKDAIERGIGMVHQHFMLIPVMTVAENIVLANEPTHAGILLDYARARTSACASSRAASTSRSTPMR